MRRSLAIAAISLGLAAGGGTAAAHTASAPAHAAKSCSSGYKHARINGAVKCLRVGQYCAHAYDRHAPRRYPYIHYGYRCVKRDSRGSYHLTYR